MMATAVVNANNARRLNFMPAILPDGAAWAALLVPTLPKAGQDLTQQHRHSQRNQANDKGGRGVLDGHSGKRPNDDTPNSSQSEQQKRCSDDPEQ